MKNLCGLLKSLWKCSEAGQKSVGFWQLHGNGVSRCNFVQEVDACFFTSIHVRNYTIMLIMNANFLKKVWLVVLISLVTIITFLYMALCYFELQFQSAAIRKICMHDE